MISRLSDLPRAPAYAGLVPTPPVFTPAAPDLAGAIMASIPGAVSIEQLSDPSGTGGRFFRAALGPAGTPLFLKLMSAADHRAVVEAEAIIAPIPADGPVVRSCGVFPVADGSQRVVVAYPYLEARFLEPTPGDMRRLGRSIAKLHALLRVLPAAEAIEARAFERARRLDATLAAAPPSLPGTTRPPPGVAAAMEGPRAQVLHGDLNVGNILAARDSIWFLDFEDVRHSYGPPVLDLALPIERFCLLLDDDGDAIASAAALLVGYAEGGGSPPIARRGALGDALGAVNRRALALLIERGQAGLDVPQSEWRKFAALLRRHAERAETIAAIETALPA